MIKEQWLRYRKEIKYLLRYSNFSIKQEEYSAGYVVDFFSEATIKEMENIDPFEGIEDVN